MSPLVKGGRVFLEGGFRDADILIENGKIKKVGPGLDKGGERPVNASGLLVVPGLIDPHVHLREPGAEYKEDFRTGTRAAVAGGFTTVMDMPNNNPPTTTAERLEEKKKLAKKKALCEVLFHFGTTDSNFEEVRKADPGSLKVYMGRTTGELMLKEKDSLERHFSEFDHRRPIVVHASDDSPDEKKNLAATYANAGHAASVAQKHGQRAHLAHVSTPHEITLFKKSANTTCEVAPHYLFLSAKDAKRLGPMGSAYPPLRSEQKRITLWHCLERIDCIATDHAPHTTEDKEAGARGFPGLETCLSLMLDAHHKGLLGIDWVIPAMTENPARIFNLRGKGRIAAGYDADLTLIDMKKEWTVDGTELLTKCRWSPFEGKRLKGRAVSVMRKGELLMEDGELRE
jgi:dihydroorotase